MIKYFVSFAFSDEGRLDFGNTVIEIENYIDEDKAINKLFKAILEMGFITPVILFYKAIQTNYPIKINYGVLGKSGHDMNYIVSAGNKETMKVYSEDRCKNEKSKTTPED